MKKRLIKSYSIIFLLLIYIIISRIFILRKFLYYSESITAFFCIIITVLSFILLGYRKNRKTRIIKYVRNIVLSFILGYISISYFIGLFVGFLGNSYSLEFYSIISNIISPVICAICIEILRYNIISDNKLNKKIFIILSVVITLFELNMNVSNIDKIDLILIFKLTAMNFLPCLIKNLLLSYLSLKIGLFINIIYRILMELYLYVVPIIPNLGDYVNCIMGMFIPFIIYLKTSKILYEYNNGIERNFSDNKFKMIDFCGIVFLITFLLLVTKVTPYYIMGIGSESMNPHIYKGDAVIVHKIYSRKNLKIGDIIVLYNKDSNKEYVHRLVKIKKRDNKIYYVTKGDNNNVEDNFNTEFKDIRGVVSLKIKYIAYPSIYIKELVKKYMR